MAIKLAEAAVRLRAEGTPETERSIARLSTRMETLSRSARGVDRAMAPLRQRLDLLMQGATVEATREVSLRKLEGWEARLTRQLERGNLTLAQRVRLQEQVARIQTVTRPVAPAVPPVVAAPTGGVGMFGGVRGVVGGLAAGFGLTMGLGAIGQGMTAMAEATDRAETAQRKLAATAKITGESLGTITGIARQAGEQFALTEGTAADFTQAIVKMTSRAGDVQQSGRFLTAWLDLAASQGMSATDAMQALETTLIGQDEGLNRLGLSNPQQIYEKWGRAAGVSAAKMTEAQKAQAIINEVVAVGGRVQGEYAKRLATTQGASERLDKAQEDLARNMGRATEGMRRGFLKAATAVTGFLANHTDLVTAIGAAVAAGGAFALLLQSIKAINAALAVTSATAIPGMLGGLVKLGRWAMSPQGLAVLAIASAIGGLTFLMQRGKRAAEEYSVALAASVNAMSPEEAKAALATLEARERVLRDEIALTANKAGMDAAEIKRNNQRNAQLTRELQLIQQQIAALRQKAAAAAAAGRGGAGGAGGGAGAGVVPLGNVLAGREAAEQMLPDAVATRANEVLAGAPIAPITVTVPVEVDADVSVDSAEAAVQGAFDSLGPSLTNVLGATLAAAFSGGMGDAGNVLLQGLGGIMQQMGGALLTYGATMLKLLPALSNPFTSGPAALIAGAALLALGAALSGAAMGRSGSRGGRGGFVAPQDTTTRIPLGTGARTPATGLVQRGAPALPAAGSAVAAPAPFVFAPTIIGPNDPVAQRQIVELVRNANRRGL